jgi:hypothetical protein
LPDVSTIADIISRAGRELGLFSANVSDPFASSDKNVSQLVALANSLGRKLTRKYRWSHLEVSYTFGTAIGIDAYGLPTDFMRLVDSSTWNRNQQLPVPNGTTPEQWEQFKARTAAGVVFKVGRIFASQLYLFPTPTAVETIAYAYRSAFWVTTAPSVFPSANVLTTSVQYPSFDSELFVSGLKLEFRAAKGLDTTEERREFDAMVAAATGGDGAAPVLSMSRDRGTEHLIDASNLPDTGYGA